MDSFDFFFMLKGTERNNGHKTDVLLEEKSEK